ncbi:MAG: hypothetical protein H0W48_01085 [Methylibium sp.]|nr:hypothetical protein [Methylibium sp.]
MLRARNPGVRKEDIGVRIDGNQVTINAEVKREKEAKDDAKNRGRLLRSERTMGMRAASSPWTATPTTARPRRSTTTAPSS